MDAFGFAARDLAFEEEEVLNVGKLDKFDSFEHSPGKELDVSEELLIPNNLLGGEPGGKDTEKTNDKLFGSIEIEEEQVISSHNFSSGFNSESEAFSQADDVFSQFSATSEKRADQASKNLTANQAKDDPFEQFNFN